MRELVDKRLMLEDVKSWVAMDSYEQHLINNMSEWIENLPTVEVSDGDCISRQAALDAMKDMHRAAEEWLRDATDDVTKARAESCMASLVEIKLRTEKLPAVQPDHNADSGKMVCVDVISRQAAIDAIGTLSDSIFKNVEKGATYPKRQWFDGMANAESIIKDLPSVLHPEIIRCEDCIHYNKHKDCIKYQRDGFCSEWARNTYKYWYCSRAERETDD